MAAEGYRFGAFSLDPVDRRLSRDGETVELNARYLDALILLVSEGGRLVTKDRFMAEVWRGVPVTDEALTQCIRTLRRALGDEAARPRFIETAPKHGYRFIAPVEAAVSAGEAGPLSGLAAPVSPSPAAASARMLLIGAAGMAGGGAAGLIGGTIYGLVGASDPSGPEMGAASVLAVLVTLTTLVGLIGGAGVGFGIAAAGFGQGRPGWRCVVGGAVGGLVVGTLTKLLGLDAFALLFGRSPGEITGGLEGLALGAAVGLGAWSASARAERPRLRRGVLGAMAAGGAAGILIALAGGRLMAGSLDLLAQRFTDSRLRLDALGALLGEAGLGPVAMTVTAGLEGALFAAGVVAAMVLAARRLARP